MFTACVAGSLIAGLIFVALGWQPMSVYWPHFLGSLKLAAFLTLVAGFTIGIYVTLRGRLDETTLQLRTKELERERALKLATEAQLASLESRIHPHFLFNTLNSISSLIPEDPARAERLVEQMAALLRFSLDANQSGLVPLASELKIVADYLDIERARFGERLRYQIDVPADLNESRIPPLSLQTLVENSVKHAIAPDRAGGEIRITGASADGGLPSRSLRFRPGVPARIGALRPRTGQSQGPIVGAVRRSGGSDLAASGRAQQFDLVDSSSCTWTCGHFWLTTKRSR